MTENDAAQLAHAAWREQRRASVLSPTGNLSLVETRWFPAGTAERDAAAQLDAEQARAGEGTVVTGMERRDIATGDPEYGLRVWDAHSRAIRSFDAIETFPFDPNWVIDARFTPVAEDRTVPFEHIRDAGGTRDLVVPGEIVFERDGQRLSLDAFNDAGTLLLVFGDLTNGRDDRTGSYGAGRFLSVDHSAGFGAPGPIRLDFNRAFVPPCGFSVHYNCPMPPPQNRLPWPVLAGERFPRFRDDFDIYAR